MTHTKWRYRTVKARPNSWQADEHPDHRFEYKIRTDDLTPHNQRQEFQARCSCGWADRNEWHRSKPYTRIQWTHHLVEARRQTELDLSIQNHLSNV